MKKQLVLIFILLCTSYASAMDIEIIDPTITQNEFKSFVKEFGYSLTFNPMAPAEPLGITGFDVGVEIVVSDISDSEGYWKKMVKGTDIDSFIPVPRLHAQKGLPFDIDVGAMLVTVPDSNIQLWGLEVKYAILKGTAVTPAFAVRAAYSQLQGVDDIDLNTLSLDALVSKGFLMLTPYGGVSIVRVSGSETSDDVSVSLDDEDEFIYRILGGLQYTPFPLLKVNLEVSYGETIQAGVKAGIRF